MQACRPSFEGGAQPLLIENSVRLYRRNGTYYGGYSHVAKSEACGVLHKGLMLLDGTQANNLGCWVGLAA